MIISFYPGACGNRYLQYVLGKEWSTPNRSYDLNNIGQIYEHRYLLGNILPTTSQYILTHCMNSNKIRQAFPELPIVFIRSSLQTSLRREWLLHGHQRFVDKDIKLNVSRLDHYCAIKDLSWPDLDSEDQIDMLPKNILKEVQNDYNKVIATVSEPVPEILSQVVQNTVSKINSAYEIITWHQQYYQTYPLDFSAADQIIDIDVDNTEFSSMIVKEINLYQSEIFDQIWQVVNE
jgi:hypothetical protein